MSRTTSANAWKPPPPHGTVSQSRADRWQNASGGSPSKRSSPALSGAHGGSKSPQKNGARAGSPGGQNAVNGAILKFKGANSQAPSSSKSFDEYDEADLALHDQWFAKLQQPASGQLSSQSKLKAKVGMSAPPQNPEVQRELLAYLREYEIKPHVETTRPRAATTSKVNDDSSPVRDSAKAKNPHSPSSHSGTMRASYGNGGAADAKTSAFKAASASTQSLSGPQSPGQGGTAARRKAAAGEQETPQRLMPNEDQIRWRTHEFHQKSREHGNDMAKRQVEELAELCTYHNGLSRNKSSGQLSPQGLSASGKLRNLGLSLTGGDDGGASPFGLRKAQSGGKFALDFGDVAGNDATKSCHVMSAPTRAR